MRQSLFGIVLWLSLVPVLFSQVGSRVGIHGGPMISELQADAGENVRYSVRPRLYLGVFHETVLSEHIGLLTELAYSGLGGLRRQDLIVDGEVVGQSDYQVNLNYLQLPIVFRFKTGGERLKMFADLGGYMGLLITAKGFFVGNTTLGDQTGAQNLYSKYRPLDGGVRAVVGLEWHAAPGHLLTLGLQFQQGLADIYAGTSPQNNRQYALTAGYFFDFNP
ncbi:MAG: porin family protein [Bacteroidetes bacterium]|nr:porin family protein [Bacteroidota bacterium]MDA0930293.1 porin family protein [Bacteroidota bacterium]